MRLTLSPDTAKRLHWSDIEHLTLAGLISLDRRDLARKFLIWSQKQIDKQAKPAPSAWRGKSA